MGIQAFGPGCALKVDCKSVQLGSRRDASWANAACRTFARAWGPICTALHDDPDRVVWMPAHNSASTFGDKKMSTGQRVRAHDVAGNDFVDGLAKRTARRESLPRKQVRLVSVVCDQLRRTGGWVLPPRGRSSGRQHYLGGEPGALLGRSRRLILAQKIAF